MTKNNRLILTFFCFFLSILLSVATNQPFEVKQYTNKSYGRHFESVNWAITQDHQGFIYTGINNGVLQYDGNQWRFLPVRNGKWIMSLASDKVSRVYVGSQNEFGYLEINNSGKYTYISLSDSLPEKDKWFTNIWRIHITSEFVIFQAEEMLFVYTKEQKLVAFSPQTSFHLSFRVQNDIFVRQRDIGLQKLIIGNDSHPTIGLKTLPGGDFFKDSGIFSIIDIGDERYIFTPESGIFQYDIHTGGVNPFTFSDKQNEKYFTSSLIYGAISADDGHIIINTLTDGIIVLNPENKTISTITKDNGLTANKVYQCIQGENGEIWCATENGISKIHYNTQISIFDEEEGIEGAVNDFALFDNHIYVATSTGLYFRKKERIHHESQMFVKSGHFNRTIQSVMPFKNSLFIGTPDGLFLLKNNTISQLNSESTFALLKLHHKDIVISGGNKGLTAYSMSRAGNWQEISTFKDISADIKGLAENINPLKAEVEIWIGTAYQGALRLRIFEDFTYETTHYTESDGLNQDWVLPFRSADSVVFGSRTGLMHFVDENTVRYTLPDSLKNNPEYYRGYFEYADYAGMSINNPLYILKQSSEKTWFSIDNQISYFNKSDKKLIRKPFYEIDLGKVRVIYPQNDILTWIGCDEGIVLYNEQEEVNYEKPFDCFIRFVTAGDSVIFSGNRTKEKRLISNDKIKLDYQYNSLTFKYTAPFFHQEEEILYSTKLQGFNEKWSGWTKDNSRVFTSLPPGHYSFKVKAKNIYGTTGHTDTFEFSIRPPWYLSGYAFAGWIVVLILLVYLVVLIANRRLRKKNEKLERIVRERTAEIRAKNETLERQKQEISRKNQDILSGIQYASRIQQALLPPEGQIEELLQEHFILYKPRDIVSGDFFWVGEKNGKTIVIAADCTGHGVPGAFVSMLGIAFLNEIINKTTKDASAASILNNLREYVIKSLRQDGTEGKTKDGMDLALCIIDRAKYEVQFSGAYNPLIMIKNGQLEQVKADKMPVAFHIKMDSEFTNHTVKVSKGDCVYLFSDGFQDQFGGPYGKKFKIKKLKEFFEQNHDKNMPEQKVMLETIFTDWKGDQEQIDDVLVVGVRI